VSTFFVCMQLCANNQPACKAVVYSGSSCYQKNAVVTYQSYPGDSAARILNTTAISSSSVASTFSTVTITSYSSGSSTKTSSSSSSSSSCLLGLCGLTSLL
jgi:hypothetical protein